MYNKWPKQILRSFTVGNFKLSNREDTEDPSCVQQFVGETGVIMVINLRTKQQAGIV